MTEQNLQGDRINNAWDFFFGSAVSALRAKKIVNLEVNLSRILQHPLRIPKRAPSLRALV